jgi:hypothetical protein
MSMAGAVVTGHVVHLDVPGVWKAEAAHNLYAGCDALQESTITVGRGIRSYQSARGPTMTLATSVRLDFVCPLFCASEIDEWSAA